MSRVPTRTGSQSFQNPKALKRTRTKETDVSASKTLFARLPSENNSISLNQCFRLFYVFGFCRDLSEAFRAVEMLLLDEFFISRQPGLPLPMNAPPLTSGPKSLRLNKNRHQALETLTTHVLAKLQPERAYAVAAKVDKSLDSTEGHQLMSDALILARASPRAQHLYINHVSGMAEETRQSAIVRHAIQETVGKNNTDIFFSGADLCYLHWALSELFTVCHNGCRSTSELKFAVKRTGGEKKKKSDVEFPSASTSHSSPGAMAIRSASSTSGGRRGDLPSTSEMNEPLSQRFELTHKAAVRMELLRAPRGGSRFLDYGQPFMLLVGGRMLQTSNPPPTPAVCCAKLGDFASAKFKHPNAPADLANKQTKLVVQNHKNCTVEHAKLAQADWQRTGAKFVFESSNLGSLRRERLNDNDGTERLRPR